MWVSANPRRHRRTLNPHMRHIQPLPIDLIHERLTYDPDTGELRHRRTGHPAGRLLPSGYVQLELRQGGVRYHIRAHRAAWVLAYNEDPYPLTIDHINMDKADNRLVNLRCVTHSENIRSGLDTTTPEQRSEWSRLAAASRTPEQRSETCRQREAAKTAEQRRASALKREAIKRERRNGGCSDEDRLSR